MRIQHDFEYDAYCSDIAGEFCAHDSEYQIELTEYDNNGRTVIFADSIQGLCRVILKPIIVEWLEEDIDETHT